MKKLFTLPLFLMIITPSIYCQRVYFKASSNYNIATSKQQMPEFFTYWINEHPINGIGEYEINFNVNEFSVASGMNFQGAIGYSFNDFLSFELKFSTFGNSKKEFKASPQLEFAPNGNSEWDLHSYTLLPTILLGQSFNKSAVNIYVYSGFGISKLSIKASLDEDYREYKFDRSIAFSWGYGLEYSYSISKNFSLVANIGFNNTNYKPDKAKLISSSYPMEYLLTNEKEIKYVDEINNLEVDYNGSEVTSSPGIRLKETLKLNSFYWGVGIKYTLIK